jgi:hypothetical protein
MRFVLRSILVAGLTFSSQAQEASSGFTMPVTLGATAMATHRTQLEAANSGASPYTAGLRAMLYPTLKLGSHWLAYGAFQLRTTPYFYYDAYNPTLDFKAHMIQGFLGYTAQTRGVQWVAKAGRLTTALGSFPLRYDDAENPLIDQPLGYVAFVRLRPDQLACGTADVLHQQSYTSGVEHYCGGATSQGKGFQPATLYGLPGFEFDAAGRHWDARVQATNSSPANPQRLNSPSQFWQTTAGGGWSIRQGLRIGASTFHGPYIEQPLAALLPVGTTPRDFSATGIGLDGQCAHGRTSISGEWQWFRFPSPRFVQQPTVRFGYGEAKVTIQPRLYLALRAGVQQFGTIVDDRQHAADSFAPSRMFAEAGFGWRLNRSQLLKASYEFVHYEGSSSKRDNILGVQFVATFHQIAKAFR